MFAVIGLGNPGSKYQETRHNAGFWVLDALASDAGSSLIPNWQTKGDCEFIKTSISSSFPISSSTSSNESAIFLKPLSYMNLSGQASRPLISFFKIKPENVIVVHDELDIAPGRINFKASGSAAGHRGVADIINSLGTNKFKRLRLGVGHPRTSEFAASNKIPVEDWVLSKPGLDEKLLLEEAVSKSVEAVKTLILEGLAAAQCKFHGSRSS